MLAAFDRTIDRRCNRLVEIHRKIHSDVHDIVHVLNVHRRKRIAASVLAVSLIDCAVSSTPAMAAEAAEPQSADGNVTINVPTKIACVVKSDGTVVAPSGWAMSNKSSGKVELTGGTAVSSYSDFRLSGKSGAVGAAVGSGSGSYSISYSGEGSGKFSCSSSKPLGISSGASLPWTWTVDKLKAGSSILDGAASGTVKACEITFSYSAVGEKFSSYTGVSTSGLVSGYLPAGGTITASASNIPSNASASYQWYVVNSDGSYTAISNATSKSFTASSSYSGKRIACRVSDGSGHYDGYVETSKVDVKQISPMATVSGKAIYGGTLTANVSNLPTDITYTKTYQWQRLSGSSWTNISNATSSTYKLGADDVSHQVRVLVKTKAGTYVIADAMSSAVSVSKASASISTTVSGVKKIEQRLAASISGLPTAGTNTITYKWQTSTDGKTWVDSTQSDAESNAFTPSYALINQYVRCIVTVTNNLYTVSGGTSSAFGTLGKASKTITASLSSPNKRNGDIITCGVSGLGVGTNTLSYKWECSIDSTFKNVSSLSDTGNVHGTVVGTGYYYRCTVSASGNQYYDYNTAVSQAYGPLSKGIASTPTVAISGSNAWGSTLTATVSNLPKYGTSSVSYQWEARNDADSAWTNSGYDTAKTNHIKIDATDAVSAARHYRCKVTVDNDQYTVPAAYSADHGKTVKANATISASISGKAAVGEKLTASVSGLPTSGANTLSYQWQYSSDGSNWTNSTGSDAKSNVKTLETVNMNFKWRCVVNATNPYYSMSSACTAASATVGKGTALAPTVSISGSKTYGSTLTTNVSGQPTGTTSASYQWQRADTATGTWANIANATGKTYKVGTSDMSKYLRVLVGTVNTYYNVPQGVSASYGPIGKASVSISATVSGSKVIESAITANVAGLPSVGTNTVSYQWQYSSDNKTWTNSGQSDAKTKTLTPNYTWVNHYARCIISVSGNAYYNVNGYTLNVGLIGKGTKTASVSLTGNAVIGGSLKANVSGLPSNGTSTIAYQWQYSSDNKTWTNSTYTDAKTATHSLAYKDAYNLYWRCNVSVSGNAYYNINGAVSAAKQCGKGTASITATVSGSTVIGGQLICSVGGLPSIGTNSLAYQWQYSADGKTWANSNNQAAKTNSINLPADDTIGKHFRCIVSATNAIYNNMTATSAATAAIGKGTHSAPTVSISGSKTYGSTLTASVSGQPSGTTATGYQWQRNSGTNGAWVSISGAIAKTYVLTSSDMNRSLRVLVNTTNTYYNVTQGTSTSYGTIGKASKTITATVSGTKSNTSKLTVSVGGLPTVGTNTVSYQWQWSKDGSTGWTNSSYADGKSNAIQMKEADVGYYYRCTVSVSGNAYYNVTGAASAAYGPMAKSNYVAPTVSISGSKTYGSTLTANVSGQPTGTTATGYQWQRASSASGSWSNISGATAKMYVAGASDMSKYLRVLVNTTNTYYNVTQGASAGYGAIGKASHVAPTVTISGDKKVGSVLTASVSGQPTGTTATGYQWQRATSATGSWSNISGATEKTYTIVDADKNQYVRVLINTTNTYYAVTQGVSAGYGTIVEVKLTAFAVYSETDNSLMFYNRATVPVVGVIFNNRKVTAVYDDIEDTKILYPSWYSYSNNIKVVDVVDTGIQPVDTSWWFCDYKNITQIRNINKLDMSKVTDMNSMFEGCTSVTQIDCSGWDTSSCVNMCSVFAQCTNLIKVNVTSFNTSKVTDFSYMFFSCKSITDLDISNFDTRKATTMNAMIEDSNSHLQRFKVGANFKITLVKDSNGNDGTLIFDPQSYNIPDADGYWYSSEGIAYKAAEIPSMKADTYYATKDKTVNRQAFAIYSDDDKSLSFYKRNDIPILGQKFNGKTATYLYLDIEAYNDLTLNQTSPWNNVASSMQSVCIVDRGVQPRSTAWWFNNMTSLISCDITKLDTSKCVNMCWMFRQCYSLTSIDVSKLDTHLVTDFSSMFRDAHEIDSLDVTGWDVSNGTNMGHMFYGCNRLTELKGAENWNTKSCEHFDYMFANDTKLTLDASKWNTAAAKGATKHTNFNLLASGVKEPTWHGLFGLSANDDNKNAVVISNDDNENDNNVGNNLIIDNNQMNNDNQQDNAANNDDITNSNNIVNSDSINKNSNSNNNSDNVNISAQSNENNIQDIN